MRNSNQLSLGMDKSPAEWMAQIRANLKKAKESGVNVQVLECQQSQAFEFFQRSYKSGRG